MPTPSDDPPSRFSSEGDDGCIEPRASYGRAFWLAYASNLLMTIAVALLFRYADFVMLLGGTEFHLGWIVGVGMVGSLVVRLALGSCIDRYGTIGTPSPAAPRACPYRKLHPRREPRSTGCCGG
jgi:hypothetical protein